MALEKKDVEMMAISIPTVDYWEMREDLDRLEDAINRLEGIVQILIEHAHDERVRDFERILKEALDREDAKKQGKTFIRPIYRIYEKEQ